MREHNWPQVFRTRVWVAVVDVLQPDRAGILGAMSDPQPGLDGAEHGHVHESEHGHAHDSGHGHAHRSGALGRLRHALRPHSHEAADKVDAAMEASAEGIRALWISLAVLAVTAVIQLAVLLISGSVALLGDTLHNAADALTAVPLGIAFLGPRTAGTPTGTAAPRTWPG
jgi:hypothetical protein